MQHWLTDWLIHFIDWLFGWIPITKSNWLFPFLKKNILKFERRQHFPLRRRQPVTTRTTAALSATRGVVYLVAVWCGDVGALKTPLQSLNDDSFQKDDEQNDWNHERLAQQNHCTERLQTHRHTGLTTAMHCVGDGQLLTTARISRKPRCDKYKKPSCR